MMLLVMQQVELWNWHEAVREAEVVGYILGLTI